MFYSYILNKLSVFYAVINWKKLKLFCKNSSLNSANLTDMDMVLHLFLKILPQTKNILHKWHSWQIPCLQTVFDHLP